MTKFWCNNSFLLRDKKTKLLLDDGFGTDIIFLHDWPLPSQAALHPTNKNFKGSWRERDAIWKKCPSQTVIFLPSNSLCFLCYGDTFLSLSFLSQWFSFYFFVTNVLVEQILCLRSQKLSLCHLTAVYILFLKKKHNSLKVAIYNHNTGCTTTKRHKKTSSYW